MNPIFWIECPATDSLRQTLWNTVQYYVHPHFQNLSSIQKMKLILASTNKNIVCEAASYTSLEEISCYRCHKPTLSRKQVKIMINSIPAMFPHSLQLHYLLQPQLCWEQIVLVTVKGYFVHRWMGHLGLSCLQIYYYNYIIIIIEKICLFERLCWLAPTRQL